MGTNDAREQLDVCRTEYAKLEARLERAERLIERVEMYVEDYSENDPVYLGGSHLEFLIAEYREESENG